MSSPKPVVGAVVVAYHSAPTLPRCVASLRRNEIASIVVVNNSPAVPLGVPGAPDLQVVTMPTNAGFAAACNAGAQRLSTEYLLFLNPDAYLKPHSLAQAVAYLAEHSRVGIVGLALEDSTGQPEPDGWGEVVSPWSLITRKLHLPSATTAPRRCGWVSGAALLVRRTVFEAVNGFDPAFFLYWEDVDLCRRVGAAGWQVIFFPAARVLHERGTSSRDLKHKTKRYDTAADRYFHKHYATTIWFMQRILRWWYRWLVPRVQ